MNGLVLYFVPFEKTSSSAWNDVLPHNLPLRRTSKPLDWFFRLGMLRKLLDRELNQGCLD